MNLIGLYPIAIWVIVWFLSWQWVAERQRRQELERALCDLLAFWLNLDPKQPHVMKTLIAGLREHHDRLIRRLSPGAMRRLHEHLFMAPKAPSKEQP